MLCRGSPNNSAKMCLNNSKRKESNKSLYMYEDGRASDAIYRVCQCIEKRKTAKRKAESGRRAVKMPVKKRNQLVKAILDKEGVTSKKLAANLNVNRFFVDRIAREAAVMTYRRAIGPEFSQELEQRQKRACRKKMGQNIHFKPYRHRGGPSCSLITLLYCGFLGVHQQEVEKGGLDPKINRF